MNQFICFRGCRDQNGIDAHAIGPVHGCGHRVFTSGQINGLSTKLTSQLQFSRIKVDAQYLATIGPQDLHSQQADQAQSADSDSFAQSRL